MLTQEELVLLEERLEKRADRLIEEFEKIVYEAPKWGNKAGRKPAYFFNSIKRKCLETLTAGEPAWPLWLDDVLAGVSRLDWYGSRHGRPLSKRNILKCFAFLDKIDAYGISSLLRVDKRQAQRYFKACSLVHIRLQKGLQDTYIRDMTYPETFIFPLRDTDLKDVE